MVAVRRPASDRVPGERRAAAGSGGLRGAPGRHHRAVGLSREVCQRAASRPQSGCSADHHDDLRLLQRDRLPRRRVQLDLPGRDPGQALHRGLRQRLQRRHVAVPVLERAPAVATSQVWPPLRQILQSREGGLDGRLCTKTDLIVFTGG